MDPIKRNVCRVHRVLCMSIIHMLSLTRDEIRMPLPGENFCVNSDRYKSRITARTRIECKTSVQFVPMYWYFAIRNYPLLIRLRTSDRSTTSAVASVWKNVRWKRVKNHQKSRASSGSSLLRWSVSWKREKALFPSSRSKDISLCVQCVWCLPINSNAIM